MKIQNALVFNIPDRSQRYFAHVTTVSLSWRVQNIVVIGRVYFTLECFEFSSNFEFDRNMLSGTGAMSDCRKEFARTEIISRQWGRDKMAAKFLATSSNVFSWMNIYIFRLGFHWIYKFTALVHITTWHRSGDKPSSKPVIAYVVDVYMRHSPSMS